MNLYQCREYREFLVAQVNEHENVRGYKTSLAQAAGCQKSFLSQVLAGKNDLNRDHGASLAEFWGMNENETEYFIALIDFQRASSPSLKNHLVKRLRTLKAQAKDLSFEYQEDELEGRFQAEYYSSWYWSAIHEIVGIAHYSTAEEISKRLKLPTITVQRSLRKLEKMKLIEQKTPGRFSLTQKNVHLSRESPMNAMNHANWRLQALSDLQRHRDDSVHYSSVFTASKKDYEKLQALLRKMLAQSRETIIASPEEELYCLNCDLFQV